MSYLFRLQTLLLDVLATTRLDVLFCWHQPKLGFPGIVSRRIYCCQHLTHTHTHTYIQMHKRTRTQLLTTKLRKPQNFHRDIFHFTLFVRLFGLPRRRIDHSSHKEKRRLSALDKGSEKIPRSTNVYSLAAGICCLDYLLRDDRQKKNKKPNRESNVKEIVYVKPKLNFTLFLHSLAQSYRITRNVKFESENAL